MSLSPEEAARLREAEAVLDDLLLAPPHGNNVIYQAPETGPYNERVLAAFRTSQNHQPLEALVSASGLHSLAGIVADRIRQPRPECQRRGPEIHRTARLAIGGILQLWKKIDVGRLLLAIWGDDIIISRRLRIFRCVLGEFSSVTHAVQELAESVLEEIWSVACAADPPAGPPYAAEDMRFERHGPLPCFRVDWWYAALPALNRQGPLLGDRWRLAGEATRWDVGLTQELAVLSVRRRRRAEQTVESLNTGLSPKLDIPQGRQKEITPKNGQDTLSERLRFDSLTQTVILDGTEHKITDPKAFAVYKAIANACPQPLTQAMIQSRVPGCRGDKKILALLRSLPSALQDTYRSGPNGYWVDLSPPPVGRKKANETGNRKKRQT